MGGACFERVGARPPLGGASFVCGNRGMLVFGSLGGATPEPIKKMFYFVSAAVIGGWIYKQIS